MDVSNAGTKGGATKEPSEGSSAEDEAETPVTSSTAALATPSPSPPGAVVADEHPQVLSSPSSAPGRARSSVPPPAPPRSGRGASVPSRPSASGLRPPFPPPPGTGTAVPPDVLETADEVLEDALEPLSPSSERPESAGEVRAPGSSRAPDASAAPGADVPNVSSASPVGDPSRRPVSPTTPQAAPDAGGEIPNDEEAATGPGADEPPGAGSDSGGASGRKPAAKLYYLAALVLVAVGVTATLTAARGAAPRLVDHAPADVQLYLEVPDFPQAVEAWGDMRVTRPQSVTLEQVRAWFSHDVARAFSIPQTQAAELVRQLKSVALLGRSVSRRPQFGWVMGFEDEAALQFLLSSPRIRALGELGTGTRYAVSPGADRPAEPGATRLRKALGRALSELSVPADQRTLAFSVFPDEGLVVFGHALLVEDVRSVLAGEEPPLSSTDAFQASHFEGNSLGVGYLHPDVLRRARRAEVRELSRIFFSEVRPLSASVELVEEGMLTVFSTQLRGKGVDEETVGAFSAPVQFHLDAVLPAETLGYLGFSLDSEMSGRGRLAAMVSALEAASPALAHRVEDGLHTLFAEFGIRMDALLELAGDEAALALALEPDFDLGQSGGVTTALVVEVADEKLGHSFLATLGDAFHESPLADVYDVSEKRGGLNAVPVAPSYARLPLFIRLGEKHLLLAAGPMGGRFVEALGGHRVLDEGFEAAVDALSSRHQARLWVDTSRLIALHNRWQKSREGSVVAGVLGEVPVGMAELSAWMVQEGEHRLSAALGITLLPEGDAWHVRVEGLNLPTLAMATSLWAVPPQSPPGGVPHPLARKTPGAPAGDMPTSVTPVSAVPSGDPPGGGTVAAGPSESPPVTVEPSVAPAGLPEGGQRDEPVTGQEPSTPSAN